MIAMIKSFSVSKIWFCLYIWIFEYYQSRTEYSYFFPLLRMFHYSIKYETNIKFHFVFTYSIWLFDVFHSRKMAIFLDRCRMLCEWPKDTLSFVYRAHDAPNESKARSVRRSLWCLSYPELPEKHPDSRNERRIVCGLPTTCTGWYSAEKYFLKMIWNLPGYIFSMKNIILFTILLNT